MLTTITRLKIAPKNNPHLVREVDVIGDYDLALVEYYHEGIVIDVKTVLFETCFFKTMWDKMQCHIESGYPRKQYNKGLNLKKDFHYVAIAHNRVWSASRLDRFSTCYSYEKLGLHAHTVALLNGMLDSGITIFDYSNLFSEVSR